MASLHKQHEDTRVLSLPESCVAVTLRGLWRALWAPQCAISRGHPTLVTNLNPHFYISILTDSKRQGFESQLGLGIDRRQAFPIILMRLWILTEPGHENVGFSNKNTTSSVFTF